MNNTNLAGSNSPASPHEPNEPNPYAVPVEVSPPLPTTGITHSQHTFIIQDGLVNASRWAWYAVAALTIATAAVIAYTLIFVGFDYDDPNLRTTDFILIGAAGAVSIATIVAIILTIIWMFRAVRNTEVLRSGLVGFPNLSIGPVLSIFGWLIPIMNLFVPFMAAKQNVLTAKAILNNQRYEAIDTPGWLSVWWAFWLGSRFALSIENRITFLDLEISPGVELVINLFSTIMTVAACVWIVKVMQRTTQLQNDADRHRRSPPTT